MLSRSGEFVTLMPGHNEPCLPASRLRDALDAFETVEAGGLVGELVRDSLGMPARRHDFGESSITTPA